MNESSREKRTVKRSIICEENCVCLAYRPTWDLTTTRKCKKLQKITCNIASKTDDVFVS